jgi:hypothetical protein
VIIGLKLCRWTCLSSPKLLIITVVRSVTLVGVLD